MKFLKMFIVYASLVFILSSCSDNFDEEAYEKEKWKKLNKVHKIVDVPKPTPKQEVEAKRLEQEKVYLARIEAKRLYTAQLATEVKELEQQIETERLARTEWLKGLKSPHELEVERAEATAKRLEQEKMYWHIVTEQDQILEKEWLECRKKEEEAKKEAERLETRRRSDEIYTKLSKKYKEEVGEYWNSLKSGLGWG